jgi:hypothetical protein
MNQKRIPDYRPHVARDPDAPDRPRCGAVRPPRPVVTTLAVIKHSAVGVETRLALLEKPGCEPILSIARFVDGKIGKGLRQEFYLRDIDALEQAVAAFRARLAPPDAPMPGYSVAEKVEGT